MKKPVVIASIIALGIGIGIGYMGTTVFVKVSTLTNPIRAHGYGHT